MCAARGRRALRSAPPRFRRARAPRPRAPRRGAGVRGGLPTPARPYEAMFAASTRRASRMGRMSEHRRFARMRIRGRVLGVCIASAAMLVSLIAALPAERLPHGTAPRPRAGARGRHHHLRGPAVPHPHVRADGRSGAGRVDRRRAVERPAGRPGEDERHRQAPRRDRRGERRLRVQLGSTRSPVRARRRSGADVQRVRRAVRHHRRRDDAHREAGHADDRRHGGGQR